MRFCCSVYMDEIEFPAEARIATLQAAARSRDRDERGVDGFLLMPVRYLDRFALRATLPMVTKIDEAAYRYRPSAI